LTLGIYFDRVVLLTAVNRKRDRTSAHTNASFNRDNRMFRLNPRIPSHGEDTPSETLLIPS